MASATLAVSQNAVPNSGPARLVPLKRRSRAMPRARIRTSHCRILPGGRRRERTLLQVGTPFDYERQMKLFVAAKMPDPRDANYRDALIHWIEHFIRQTHGKAFVLFTISS